MNRSLNSFRVHVLALYTFTASFGPHQKKKNFAIGAFKSDIFVDG